MFLFEQIFWWDQTKSLLAARHLKTREIKGEPKVQNIEGKKEKKLILKFGETVVFIVKDTQQTDFVHKFLKYKGKDNGFKVE